MGPWARVSRGLEGLINVARHTDDWKEIENLAREYKDRFPKHWRGYDWLGQAYLNTQQTDKALMVFNEILDIFPKLNSPIENCISVLRTHQNWQGVIKLTQKLINNFPDNHTYYFQMGESYKNLAQYDEAKHYFDLLIEKFPSNHEGYQGYIHIGSHKNDWQESYQACLVALEHFPDNTNFHYQKGIALKNLKRFEEAEDLFRELKLQFSDSHLPFTGLATVYATLRKWKDAIYELQQALLRFPKHNGVARQLINQLLNYNEPDEALAIFDKYISYPNNIPNQLLLARIYQAKNGNKEYLDRLEVIYEKYPDDISVAQSYANALINLTMEED